MTSIGFNRAACTARRDTRSTTDEACSLRIAAPNAIRIPHLDH
jgi:hypothetical protein